MVVSNILFIFTPTWGKDPIWLIFFRWVETTNYSQLFLASFYRDYIKWYISLFRTIGSSWPTLYMNGWYLWMGINVITQGNCKCIRSHGSCWKLNVWNPEGFEGSIYVIQNQFIQSIYCFKLDVKKEVLKMCDLNDFFLYTTTTKGTPFTGNQLSKYVSNEKRPSC